VEFVPPPTIGNSGDLDEVLGIPPGRVMIQDSRPPTWQGATLRGLGSDAQSGAILQLVANLLSVATAGAAAYYVTGSAKAAAGVSAATWGAAHLPHAISDKRRLLYALPAIAAGAGLLWWHKGGGLSALPNLSGRLSGRLPGQPSWVKPARVWDGDE